MNARLLDPSEKRPKLLRLSFGLFAAAALWIGFVGAASAQMRSEMRDPVRGVSFHSIEISTQPINALDVVAGSFADADRLSIGLSAMIFDGASEVDSWILWIRHEGRRWLDYDRIMPVNIVANGSALDIESLRSPQPFVGEAGLRYEKLEFQLDAETLRLLVDAKNIVIELRTDNGDVDKHLSRNETERLREFVASIDGGVTSTASASAGPERS